jgi:hypothetical protein
VQNLNLTGTNRVSDQAEQKLRGLTESADEVSLLQEMLFQTRTETTRLRRRLERQELIHDSHVRHARVAWVVTLLIAAGFVAGLWFRFSETGSLLAGIGGSAPALKIPDTGLEPPKPPTASSVGDSGLGSSEVTSKPEQPTRPAGSSTLLLADSVKRSRTDFVLPLNKTWEVSPGIFLTVRETSVTSQRIDGSLQIAEEGRTVPIRSQSLQTPATFTTKHDERKRAVVFTRIDRQQVVGYLLIPLPAG